MNSNDTNPSSFVRAIQQRAVMSRSELRDSIDEILSLGIDENEDGEPNLSQLRKASRQLDLIMAAVETYVARS